MTNSCIKKINDILPNLPNASEVSISMTDAGKTTFTGLRKDKNGIESIDNKTTVFEIGSVTKAFTGHVLARLVTDHKIKLDDPIASFLSFKLSGNPGITFRQLALHTSGLPRMPHGYDDRPDFIKENPFSNYNEESFIHYLRNALALESLPGEKASYSNLGYALLSYGIAQIENKPFNEVVKEMIFQPLSMKNSTFNAKDNSSPVKAGLDKTGHPTLCWDAGVFNGSLGILSTAQDLSLFSKMMLDENDPAIRLQIQNTFPAKPDVHTCMGWLMVNFDQNQPIIKINGGTGGSSSSIFINHKKQKAFTFCSNIHPDSYMQQIEHLCIEAVL